MKSNQLKELLKHIINEVKVQFEMIEQPIGQSYIDSGFHKITDQSARVLSGDKLPKTGYEKLVKAPEWLHTTSGVAWLAKTQIDGQMVWSVRDAKNRKMREMIANKDVPPDVFGAVNVEENKKKYTVVTKKDPAVPDYTQYIVKNSDNRVFFSSYDKKEAIETANSFNTFKIKEIGENLFNKDVKKKAKELFGKVKKITKISHPESNSEYFKIILQDPDSEHTIRKEKSGKFSLGKEIDGKLSFEPVDEETGTGSVAGYSTPFAFKATGGAGERRRKKKRKHVREIHGSLKNEKTLPDGKYADDMEDGIRSNRISGMNETDSSFKNLSVLEKELNSALSSNKTHIDFEGHKYATGYVKYIIGKMKLGNIDEMTSSGAVGQPGGMIQTPAWGTKNKLGSPRGIKGSEKLGYKVVKSITN